MRSPRARNLVLFVAGCLLCAPVRSAAQAPGFRFEANESSGTRWFKGNTHAHTLESDGDSPPEEVATWYKQHGYDFLVLSDHNVLTDPATLAHLVDDEFILISGEEVTSSFERRPVHINGLNVNELVVPQQSDTMVGTIQRNIDAIREVEGAPHINHPNFGWAFGAEELAQVQDDRLLEIYNGHPIVHNDGGGDSPGMETVWDYLLTRGKRIYGIAVDDAHHFKEFGRDRANPGRGWVTVRAPGLSAPEIISALEAGSFYASTGVELDDIVVTDRRIELRIRPQADFKHTTRFIGAGGRTLAETGSNPAVFDLAGPEIYVRAVVRDSGGRRAWIQPLFVVKD